MNTAFPQNLFGARDEVKSLLAALLPDLKPNARLELFAQEAGYSSDAAFRSSPFEQPSLQGSKTELSIHAAKGRVLPLLVATSKSLLIDTENSRSTARPIAPNASQILKVGLELLDKREMRSSMGSLIPAAQSDPEGAPRWFFAVAAASAILKEKENDPDAFWLRKSTQLLCGILSLSEHIHEGRCLDLETVRHLLKKSKNSSSPWEKVGVQILNDFLRKPEDTQFEILRVTESFMWPEYSEEDPLDIGIYPPVLCLRAS